MSFGRIIVAPPLNAARYSKGVRVHGMNVRVRIQPGKVEEVASLLREEIMPTAANYRGFIQTTVNTFGLSVRDER